MISHSIILFYNKPALTARCLQSVLKSLAHAGLRDHHILLVDNGSSAETVRQMQQLTQPGVEIYTLPINQGFSKAMNEALKKSFSQGATQVAMFSNDIEVAEDFYRNAQSKILGPNEIQCPHTYFLMDRTKPSYTHGVFDPTTKSLKHLFDPTTHEITFPNYYPAAAMVWGGKAFEATKGFNENYFCYWEDVDLSQRINSPAISQQNIKCISNPNLKVHHLGRGTTAGKKKYSLLFEEGKNRFVETNAKH